MTNLKIFRIYQQALINMVKYGGKPRVDFPSEAPFLAYNGQTVSIFKNLPTVLGPAPGYQTTYYQLSGMGIPKTDAQVLQEQSDPMMNPASAALTYGMSTVAGFNDYLTFVNDTTRTGDPVGTENALAQFFNAGYYFGIASQTFAMADTATALGSLPLPKPVLSDYLKPAWLQAEESPGNLLGLFPNGANNALFRLTMEGESFIHYGYFEHSEGWADGARPGTYVGNYFGEIEAATGAQAQNYFNLPRFRMPPNAYYIIRPPVGTVIQGPGYVMPAYGNDYFGLRLESIFPYGTPKGSVYGPYPIPPR